MKNQIFFLFKLYLEMSTWLRCPQGTAVASARSPPAASSPGSAPRRSECWRVSLRLSCPPDSWAWRASGVDGGTGRTTSVGAGAPCGPAPRPSGTRPSRRCGGSCSLPRPSPQPRCRSTLRGIDFLQEKIASSPQNNSFLKTFTQAI